MPCCAHDDVKEFSIIIEEPEAEYMVEVGGTLDPQNLEITFENIGDTPLVNPRITVNGLFDWSDANAIVAEATRGCQTDEEKALALWAWVLYKRFQRSPDDPSAVHPVRAMNGYGYGICGHTAAWLNCLWAAAGLQARVQELWGHTVCEVSYDGAWHLFDGNCKAFYLDRDNRTIASLATVEHDRWLVERTIHAHDPWLRQPDAPERNAVFVRYLTSYKDNFEEHAYDREIAEPYTMAMALKPGEKLIRWWGPELGKFEGRHRSAEVPQCYANGQLIWEPDLQRINMRPYLSSPAHGNIATRAEDGRDPAIHVADLQDSLYTRPSWFTIPIASPYPVLGARVTCTLVKAGESELDLASVSFGPAGFAPGDLYVFRWGKGTEAVSLDLDHRLSGRGGVYNYDIGFTVRGNGESDPPTQAGLDGLRVVTDLQVSPHSLPALMLGKNTVRFWCQSPDGGRARITHRWREVSGSRPPGTVEVAVAPADGDQTASLAPILKWLPAVHPDPHGEVVDYQVMVSLRPDCRWPLSPALHQNVGSAETEWTAPEGFLNPRTTYYWKVRARDRQGIIGEWSRIFRFATAAQPE
jgi:hypothetical protein